MLLEIADKLEKKGITLILIQISEAHTNLWPVHKTSDAQPQKDIADRLERANSFYKKIKGLFPVYVDHWDNRYAEKFHAWPDKFNLIDKDRKIIAHSEYGAKEDALINKDYIVYLHELLEEQ